MPTFDLKTTGKDMQGSLEHTLRDFATLRVGMASANFLDTVSVEAYGQFMPIKQTATISVADNFTLIVAPFDKGNIKAIIPKIIITENPHYFLLKHHYKKYIYSTFEYITK